MKENTGFTFSPEKRKDVIYMFLLLMVKRKYGWNPKIINLTPKEVREILEIIKSKEEVINAEWNSHFENR